MDSCTTYGIGRNFDVVNFLYLTFHLIFIRDMETRETNASWNDLQHLIMARNKIVAGIEEVQLVPGFEGLSRPYMVDFDRHCSNCEYRTVCALSLK